MLFSIIVPIYKVEKQLNKCVDSLLNQTYADIEIILVDDGSPDNCPQICDEYARNDSRIRVIHKENGGLSDARNAGLSIASGEYVMFVDSDDYIETDACYNFVEYTRNNADIIIGRVIVHNGKAITHIDNFEQKDGKCYLEKALRAKKFPKVAWCNIYKRVFLLNNNLFFKKGILHEDEQFVPRAFLLANNVVLSNLFFYHYVIRDNSISTKKDLKKNSQDIYNICIELKSLYDNIENKKLRKLLLDDLVTVYLNMFQIGKIYKYGREYIHKRFVFVNAKTLKTKLKALLFVFSVRLYYFVNKGIKQLRR